MPSKVIDLKEYFHSKGFETAPPERAPAERRFGLEEMTGRLVELSAGAGSATLTVAAGIVLEAQRAGEPAAWVSGRGRTVYPPDLAEVGIDIGALCFALVHGPVAAARSADFLLRSGAFGLVVVDLGRDAEIPVGAQTRLLGHCQQHDAALVFLTEKVDDAPSIGSLVSLRAACRRSKPRPRQALEVTAEIVKDKRRGPGWVHQERVRGPAGLR